MLRTSKRCTHERIHAEPKAHAKETRTRKPRSHQADFLARAWVSALREMRRWRGVNAARMGRRPSSNEKRTLASGLASHHPKLAGAYRARAFLFCHNVHSNPQTSSLILAAVEFKIGACSQL